MAKQLCFDVEALEALKEGVVKLARAVKSTLGPRGRSAVIDRGWGGPNITKDGYTVADEVDLKDKYENLGAQLLKEAASKTHDVSGDGTRVLVLTPTPVDPVADRPSVRVVQRWATELARAVPVS